MEDSNIVTIAWTGIINSKPPLVYVSIRESRYSHDIIKNEKEFVINLPDETLAWQADFCGTKSGKNVDKFKEANLSKGEAVKVNCPVIKECPINIECKLNYEEVIKNSDIILHVTPSKFTRNIFKRI